jgi:serine protease Do
MAIIKIDPKAGETLPTIPLGDSSKLEVGEAVVAIGNALGLDGGPTVTSGIVGAVGRSINESGGAQLSDLIQTDAAINPGNSGGPLLNLRGELVGMNTAAPVVQSSGEVAQGIGFALAINQLRPLIDSFVKGTSLERPFMGILPQAMTSALAARYQLPVNYGILIGRVDANSPAAQAGWKAGEIIVKMDGKDLRSLNDLSVVLQKHKPGDKVSVTVVDRSGKQREAPITFGSPPAQG